MSYRFKELTTAAAGDPGANAEMVPLVTSACCLFGDEGGRLPDAAPDPGTPPRFFMHDDSSCLYR